MRRTDAYIEKPVFEFLMLTDPLCEGAWTEEQYDMMLRNRIRETYRIYAQNLKTNTSIPCFIVLKCGKSSRYYFMTNGNSKEEIKSFIGDE